MIACPPDSPLRSHIAADSNGSCLRHGAAWSALSDRSSVSNRSISC
jgi:hypothetical protein